MTDLVDASAVGSAGRGAAHPGSGRHLAQIGGTLAALVVAYASGYGLFRAQRTITLSSTYGTVERYLVLDGASGFDDTARLLLAPAIRLDAALTGLRAEDIGYFARAARYGSFHRAAEVQSAVSTLPARLRERMTEPEAPAK